MGTAQWLTQYAADLQGKRVAVTGASGGLGEQICRHLAHCGADLILLNRNPQKTDRLIQRLQAEFPTLRVTFVPIDLEQLSSVRLAALRLQKEMPDVLIHNAGAYHIPRSQTPQGMDNLFQINFFAPYYLTRLLLSDICEKQVRVVTVNSLAHRFCKTDAADIEGTRFRMASLAYGNAKRYGLLSLSQLSKREGFSFCAVHPGITATDITAHYPKAVRVLIKYPMKVLFHSPKKAALCVVQGVCKPCRPNQWIGPRFWGIWGTPRTVNLKAFTEEETQQAFEAAERLFREQQRNGKE